MQADFLFIYYTFYYLFYFLSRNEKGNKQYDYATEPSALRLHPDRKTTRLKDAVFSQPHWVEWLNSCLWAKWLLNALAVVRPIY